MLKFLRRLLLLILIVVLVTTVIIPWFFEDKLGEVLKEQVNRQIHATLDFDRVDLSLYKGFPNAYVTISEPVLINKFPFQGDTLFSAQELSLEMSLGELFNGRNKPIAVQRLDLEEPSLRIRVDLLGRANYDLERPGGADQAGAGGEESKGGIRFDLKRYEITNGTVVYDDEKSRIHLEIRDMMHYGFGDLSLETSELQTETEANVSFEYDSITYLKDNRIALSAGFGIDLGESKYVFLKNQALVNNLPLVFDGYVQMLEEGQEIDLKFKTPSSDFNNFLAVIPERYARDLGKVETQGNFAVNGSLKGLVTDDRIPTFDIKILAEEAGFRYPELEKSVKNVNIDARFYNTTGIVEDSYVDLRNLSFDLDGDAFRSTALIEQLTGNTRVKAEIKGKINLSNIARAYPMPSDYDLRGKLDVDVSTEFDMEAVEEKDYARTQTKGMLRLKEFLYNSDELRNPVEIDAAAVNFSPNRVDLSAFDARIGKSDIKANGTIDNLLGFLFNKEDISGNFDLQSRQFVVNDFIVDEEVTVESDKPREKQQEYTVEKIRIPSFLDCKISARADQVLYDNMTIRKVSGELRVKDQTAVLSNLKGELFGGNIALTGQVSTAGEVPSFDMKLDANALNIGEAFTTLNLFQALSPIGGAMQGSVSSSMNFSGLLKDNLTLELGSVLGQAQSSLSNTTLDSRGTPLLLALDREFDQISFDDWKLDGTRVSLQFEDGRVRVKPFKVMLRDIPLTVSGGHGFDRSLDYQLDFEIPSKYLGQSVTNLIIQLDDPGLLDMKIPVRAELGGSISSPRLKSDLTFVVENLTKRLIERQKERMLNRGATRAGDLLEGLLGGGKKTADSAQKDSTRTKVSSALGKLLSGKKKDTTQQP